MDHLHSRLLSVELIWQPEGRTVPGGLKRLLNCVLTIYTRLYIEGYSAFVASSFEASCRHLIHSSCASSYCLTSLSFTPFLRFSRTWTLSYLIRRTKVLFSRLSGCPTVTSVGLFRTAHFHAAGKMLGWSVGLPSRWLVWSSGSPDTWITVREWRTTNHWLCITAPCSREASKHVFILASLSRLTVLTFKNRCVSYSNGSNGSIDIPHLVHAEPKANSEMPVNCLICIFFSFSYSRLTLALRSALAIDVRSR